VCKDFLGTAKFVGHKHNLGGTAPECPFAAKGGVWKLQLIHSTVRTLWDCVTTKTTRRFSLAVRKDWRLCRY